MSDEKTVDDGGPDTNPHRPVGIGPGPGRSSKDEHFDPKNPREPMGVDTRSERQKREEPYPPES